MKKSPKERLTVTVDPELVRAANEAVARGRAASLSAWVNAALMDRVVHERRLAALGDAIEAYEARHGRFTEEELAEQARLDRERRIVIGARRRPARRRRAA